VYTLYSYRPTTGRYSNKQVAKIQLEQNLRPSDLQHRLPEPTNVDRRWYR